jgi:hypothetical protein
MLPGLAALVLGGCSRKEPPPPETGPTLADLALQVSGQTNPPPAVTNQEPAHSTDELIRMAAGADNMPSGMAAPRTFLDGFREKAEKGDAEAMYWLGYYLVEGQQVKQDLKEGARWLQESAEHNHKEAQYRIGLAYESGRGVPKDPVLAYHWHYLAAQKGHLDAIEHRDKLAGQLPDFEVEKGRRLAEQFVPK